MPPAIQQTVIIYSTSGTPSIVKKAHECRAYQYLVKPSSMEQIKKMIKELLAIPVQGQQKSV